MSTTRKKRSIIALSFADLPEPITYYEYATDKQYHKFNLLGTIKKYTIGLPGVIVGAIRGV